MAAYPDYDATDNDKLKALNEEGNERLAIYFYFINSNKNKHSNILIDLNSKKSLKNDQCSKTIIDRHNILSNHKTAKEFKKNNKNKSPKKDADEETNVLSFAQAKEKCWVCGAKEHGALDCKK